TSTTRRSPGSSTPRRARSAPASPGAGPSWPTCSGTRPPPPIVQRRAHDRGPPRSPLAPLARRAGLGPPRRRPPAGRGRVRPPRPGGGGPGRRAGRPPPPPPRAGPPPRPGTIDTAIAAALAAYDEDTPGATVTPLHPHPAAPEPRTPATPAGAGPAASPGTHPGQPAHPGQAPGSGKTPSPAPAPWAAKGTGEPARPPRRSRG